MSAPDPIAALRSSRAVTEARRVLFNPPAKPAQPSAEDRALFYATRCDELQRVLADLLAEIYAPGGAS